MDKKKEVKYFISEFDRINEVWQVAELTCQINNNFIKRRNDE